MVRAGKIVFPREVHTSCFQLVTQYQRALKTYRQVTLHRLCRLDVYVYKNTQPAAAALPEKRGHLFKRWPRREGLEEGKNMGK